MLKEQFQPGSGFKSDSKRPVAGEVRLETARREQLELVPTNIDELIAADQPARAIWILVKTLDLRCFRGLDRFVVRTLPKVTCVVLRSVIAYDLIRFFKLTH